MELMQTPVFLKFSKYGSSRGPRLTYLKRKLRLSSKLKRNNKFVINTAAEEIISYSSISITVKSHPKARR